MWEQNFTAASPSAGYVKIMWRGLQLELMQNWWMWQWYSTKLIFINYLMGISLGKDIHYSKRWERESISNGAQWIRKFNKTFRWTKCSCSIPCENYRICLLFIWIISTVWAVLYCKLNCGLTCKQFYYKNSHVPIIQEAVTILMHYSPKQGNHRNKM